ncbi:hypothetical protein [Polaromonas sp.]|uniref:hypothetical protein n=1 Tax=Polaromonas sp. TaxID=1869339 RepID=UPI00272FF5B2|nr:hypothetical protein [Polaromonas sp.]MDP1740973.1 hypothetical protein [Polaromonas sp.]
MAAARRSSNQITVRYRTTDSVSGVTRVAAKRLADLLGIDETQVIHHALRELAVKLGRYEVVAATREVTELKGMFGLAKKSVSIASMNAAIAQRGSAAR